VDSQSKDSNYEKNSERAEPTNSGRLQDHSARKLIEQLHRQNFSGSLLLGFKEKRKKLWFSEGEIFRIQSNLVPELFGQMLVERGWMSESDLRSCLKLQKDLFEQKKIAKKLGDFAQELSGVDALELAEVYQFQSVNSLLQSMTWEEGTYEILPMGIQLDQAPTVLYRDLMNSIQSLFEFQDSAIPPLFQSVKPWQPKSQSVDLAKTPLWLILAGCQRTRAHGILTIRKQNKLFEIVIKNGIPLLLYEGTFRQPRQILIVRKASEEHENFFVGQIFKLFSFLTGSAHFRSLGARREEEERDSFMQILPDSEESMEKETLITKTVKPESETPFDLKSHFLAIRTKTNLIHKTIKKFIRFAKF